MEASVEHARNSNAFSILFIMSFFATFATVLIRFA